MVQTDSLKPHIVIITGPTASGKSAIAVQTAEKFSGEIISCDSMQIYRGMNIGTGKITEPEKRGITHHLIDIVDPGENFSVSMYKERAEAAISQILAKGKLPVITGGTGLYINALIYGLNFAETPASEEIRNELKNIAAEKGSRFLYDQLVKADAESAEKISPNDVRRIIRALEIYRITGKPKSRQATHSSSCPYDVTIFVLTRDRAELYEKINSRVDKMISDGLVDEVRALYRYKQAQSMQAIGYKEILDYIDGKIPLNDAVSQIKQNTRRYAKRQITFFKKLPDAIFTNPDFENISKIIENKLKII